MAPDTPFGGLRKLVIYLLLFIWTYTNVYSVSIVGCLVEGDFIASKTFEKDTVLLCGVTSKWTYLFLG
jgi:hypothetical protein